MLKVVTWEGPALSRASRVTRPISFPLSTTGRRLTRWASIILRASAREVVLEMVTTLVVMTSRTNMVPSFVCSSGAIYVGYIIHYFVLQPSLSLWDSFRKTSSSQGSPCLVMSSQGPYNPPKEQSQSAQEETRWQESWMG